MDHPDIQEIIRSIEEKSLLELRDLAELFQKRFTFPAAEPPAPERSPSAYWTPYYALRLVRADCKPGSKIRAVRIIRELSCCSLAEAKEMLEDPDILPKTIWSQVDEHPSEARRKIQPVREELESLGLVFDEDYNYGYFD